VPEQAPQAPHHPEQVLDHGAHDNDGARQPHPT
jgi:hypothetical protein